MFIGLACAQQSRIVFFLHGVRTTCMKHPFFTRRPVELFVDIPGLRQYLSVCRLRYLVRAGKFLEMFIVNMSAADKF